MEEDTSFLPPIIWLLLWAIYFFSLLRYPVENIHHYGQQLLVKNESRNCWWFSKMIWIICGSAYFHVVYAFVLFICNICISHYPLRGTIDNNVLAYILDINHFYLLKEGAYISVIFIISAIIMGIFLCMLQLLIALKFKPIYSYLCIIGFLIGSSFLKNSFLVGNYMLLIRLEHFRFEGLDYWNGLVIGIVGCLYVIFLGKEYFLEYDIL